MKYLGSSLFRKVLKEKREKFKFFYLTYFKNYQEK